MQTVISCVLGWARILSTRGVGAELLRARLILCLALCWQAGCGDPASVTLCSTAEGQECPEGMRCLFVPGGDGAERCYGVESALTWVQVPGGTFQMGSTAFYEREQPVRSVTVPSFELTWTEVTATQYGACVSKGGCTAPSGSGPGCNYGVEGREDHPVNCVDWHQAKVFCIWAGGRLPTEAQWEYAARSGGQDIQYPWGDEEATCAVAVMNEDQPGCGSGGTSEVCSRQAGSTIHGLCDMAGNVWEWLEDDWHESYQGAPSDGSAWVDEPRGPYRVRRGGCFERGPVYQRAAHRLFGAPFAKGDYLGFRCAR